MIQRSSADMCRSTHQGFSSNATHTHFYQLYTYLVTCVVVTVVLLVLPLGSL